MRTNALKPVAKPARMIDVARAAGVSRAAVSAVLSGSGTGKGNIAVAEKTAARIRRIAQELNFHPNHAARQLAGKRSHIIGTLAKTWFGQTEQRALGWLNHVASARGRKILAWEFEADPTALNAFVDECLGWNIEGLIFVAFKYETVWQQVAKALGRVPRVVSIVENAHIPHGYAVEVDVADGVRQSVSHLHAQGHKRIVQVLEGLDATMDRQRHAAFHSAHQEHYGTAADTDQVCLATAGWTTHDFPKYQELARELAKVRRADAILAESDFTAPGLIRGLTNLGLRVPDDVALVGWGAEAMSLGVTPGLTTIDFDFGEIVGRALDLLNDLIEHPGEERPRSIFVKPKLLVRETA
jgi:LacI family transcriptional regulator